MNHIRNTRDWTEEKSFKLRFQYLICFEMNDFPPCVALAFSYFVVHKVRMGLQMQRFSLLLQQSQKNLAIT